MQEALYGTNWKTYAPCVPLVRGDETAAHAATCGEWAGGREEASALLALSHTRVEQKLYVAMAAAVNGAARRRVFSVPGLMEPTGLRSYSTIRRGLVGLISKQTVARGAAAPRGRGHVYEVFGPEEIFARRRERGLAPYPREVCASTGDAPLGVAVTRVAERHELSRREAQVALACVDGLTNAEIGEKLFVSEQTVKFHLRHIFTKLRVRRRAELVSLLLRQ